jgi:hypothetical protein
MWSPGRINGTSGSRGGAEWADLWPLGDDIAPTSPEDDCFLSFSGLRHARVFQPKDDDDAMGGMASRERLTREGMLISDRSMRLVMGKLRREQISIVPVVAPRKVRDMCDASPLCFDPVSKHPVRMAFWIGHMAG